MAYVLARPWLVLLLAGIMIICLCGALHVSRAGRLATGSWLPAMSVKATGSWCARPRQRDRGGQRPRTRAQCEGVWTGLRSPGYRC